MSETDLAGKLRERLRELAAERLEADRQRGADPGGPVCEWCQRKAHGSCDGWIAVPDDPDTGACRCECRTSENAAAGRREGTRP